VLRWRYFIEWVWRGRDEKSRTVEKSEIGRGDQKSEETCFWDFHIPRQMAQRDWALSYMYIYVYIYMSEKEAANAEAAIALYSTKPVTRVEHGKVWP